MNENRKLGLRGRYGPYALVTGAARGIGRAYATFLAADGFELLLVDRQEKEVNALADSLASAYGIRAHAVGCDLTRNDLADTARRWAEAYHIGLLVNNAGVSDLDPFLDIPLEAHLEALDLNCRATLILTHVMGRTMVARQRGAIIMVSSLSGLSGSPYFCHYAATKGYGLNLACGLWSELRRSGIDVQAVCPGMTDTGPVRDRGLHRDLPFYVPLTQAEPVALASLRALGKQPVVVPRWGDRVSAGLLSKLAPRAWTLSIMKRSIEKMRR